MKWKCKVWLLGLYLAFLIFTNHHMFQNGFTKNYGHVKM